MKFFALKIAYNGSVFSGFAPQRTPQILSVSEALESALLSLGITTRIIASGRTDKGVHALGLIVRISTQECWNAERLYGLLARKLPIHIKLRALWEVPSHFHPRYHATARSYLYVCASVISSPFVGSFVSKERIGDVARVKQCLQSCIGRHDVALFSKTGSHPHSTIKHIYAAYMSERSAANKPYYVIRIVGSGFLRAQVRLMLGAMFAVSRGEITHDDFIAQLNGIRRSYAMPASPHGLYFGRAWYKNVWEV